MQFVFKCQVVRHVSGRVTVTPVELPELAVHATDVPAAIEVLTLALDDRIGRAHPRHLPTYARPAQGTLLPLAVPSLEVHGAEGPLVRPLLLAALQAPVQKPYTEVRVPALDARFWLKERALEPVAVKLVAELLADVDEPGVLACRSEGSESLFDLVVEATPLQLADLRRRELVLDERPPPGPPEEEAVTGAGADDHDADDLEAAERAAAEADDDDDWDRTRPRRKARGKRKAGRPATPTLKRIGVAWHELAAAGELDPAWERDALVTDLLGRLERDSPDPVVLVGPDGAGKTAILQELARRLVAAAPASSAPEDPGPRPFFHLDASRMIAGEGFFGDWQRQVLEAWREAQAAGAILCVGRVVELLDAGKSAHSDQNVAGLLAGNLNGREVALLGEATAEEWTEVERRNAAFARAFAVLRVEELAPAATERVLAQLAALLAPPRGLRVADGVVGEVVSLCARFQPYGALLGNAVALLRRLIETRAQALATELRDGDPTAHFCAESGIPPVLVRDDLPLDEDQVESFLAARVHGQAAATRRVARVVSVIKANLTDRSRPAAVLLFAGPTGVGKTELSKALAEQVFGSRDRLVRLDMGEYGGPDALLRLIGEPGAAGHLTQAVRRQPFSLVLLDEIEKAHPAVFDALLGVLGEGRLTDGAGKLVDFRAAVIVMTSNLGADTLRPRPGFGGSAGEAADLEAHYRAEARRFFRPELFNRLDDVVVFSPLGLAQVRTIVDRELLRVTEREGLRRRDVHLEIDEAARQHLAAVGLDPRYGARPLKRALERHLVARVAGWLAEHPPAGAVELAFQGGGPAGRELTLAAQAAAADSGPEGALSRTQLLEVVERAAAVRAEVRRWSRCDAMIELGQKLAFFDRASRQPRFWDDRALADESARTAAEARDLEKAFLQAEQQAEAAEDLAYEAWYARQGAAAGTLEGELDVVTRALRPLRVRLFASLWPPRSRVVLELIPGKGAWSSLCWLVAALQRWLQTQGAKVELQTLRERQVPAKEVRVGKGPKPARGKKGEEATVTVRRWKTEELDENDAGPLAVVLQASGSPAILLLSAEHGTHRFTQMGQTLLVRCRFEPQPTALAISNGADLPDLEKRMPTQEIRRIRADKRELRDLRTGFELNFEPAEVDLGPLYDAYLSWRVLGSPQGTP